MRESQTHGEVEHDAGAVKPLARAGQKASSLARVLAVGPTITTFAMVMDGLWLAWLSGPYGKHVSAGSDLLVLWPVHIGLGVCLALIARYGLAGASVVMDRLRGGGGGLRSAGVPLTAAWVLAVQVAAECITRRAPTGIAAALALLAGAAAFFATRKFRRPTVPWLFGVSQAAALGFILLSLGIASRFHAPEREVDALESPNLFYIVVDTLRADHVGCYGYPRPTSPHLDRFAQRSLLFEKAYAAAPATTPSVAAILGATFPFVRFPENGSHVASFRLRFLEALKDLGYVRAGFSANPWVSQESGFAEHFDTFWSARAFFKDYSLTYLGHLFLEQIGLDVWDPLRAQFVNKAVLEYLSDRRSSAPLFCYLHYMDPHYPYTPQRKFRRRFLAPQAPRMQRFPVSFQRTVFPYIKSEALTERQRQAMVALYDAEIAQWDESFGVLLTSLRQQDLLDNALVIVTADHGESFYDHYDWMHDTSLFDEALHVPLLVRFPGSGVIGTVTPAVSNLVATELALQWARTRKPPRLEFPSDAKVVSQWSTREGAYRGASLLQEGMKSILLVHGTDTRRLLFDHATDAGEQVNLVEKQADRFPADLRVLVPQPSEGSRKVDLSRQQTEQMKALGYLR